MCWGYYYDKQLYERQAKNQMMDDNVVYPVNTPPEEEEEGRLKNEGGDQTEGIITKEIEIEVP